MSGGNGNGKPKTYEQLKSEAAQKWQRNAMIREQRQSDMMAMIVECPDVKQAPTEDTIYEHPQIQCPCGGKAFQVKQWTCCNGKVERAVLQCRTCTRTALFDFLRMRWAHGD